MKRIPLIISFVFFVLLCASISFWAMHLIKPQVRKILAPQITKPVADVESVASLFGGAMLVDTSYQLKGLIQANPMNESVAVIGVDGKPTKAYSFDSEVNPGSALNEVYSNYILLKDNGINKRVELPQETTSTQITEVIRSPIDTRPSDSSAEKTVLDRKMPKRQSRGVRPSPPSVPVR